MRRILPFMILAAVLTAAAVPVQAAGLTGAGLQIGWSTSPDDFLVGFHYNARPMGEELDLVPSLDFGFGDVTMIAPNLDAHYVLKTSSKLRPYVGAGITAPWYDFEGDAKWQFGGPSSAESTSTRTWHLNSSGEWETRRTGSSSSYCTSRRISAVGR